MKITQDQCKVNSIKILEAPSASDNYVLKVQLYPDFNTTSAINYFIRHFAGSSPDFQYALKHYYYMKTLVAAVVRIDKNYTNNLMGINYTISTESYYTVFPNEVVKSDEYTGNFGSIGTYSSMSNFDNVAVYKDSLAVSNGDFYNILEYAFKKEQKERPAFYLNGKWYEGKELKWSWTEGLHYVRFYDNMLNEHYPIVLLKPNLGSDDNILTFNLEKIYKKFGLGGKITVQVVAIPVDGKCVKMSTLESVSSYSTKIITDETGNLLNNKIYYNSSGNNLFFITSDGQQIPLQIPTNLGPKIIK